MQALEAEVKRLESELATARRAESVLEIQKQENLQLKETIDRMRFDLEEAKNNAANAGKGHGRTATSNSSVEGTMSRNLGDEISRRLQDAQAVPEEEDEEGDSYIETVVTTQRTRVGVGHRAESKLTNRRLEAANRLTRTPRQQEPPRCRLSFSKQSPANMPTRRRSLILSACCPFQKNRKSSRPTRRARVQPRPPMIIRQHTLPSRTL